MFNDLFPSGKGRPSVPGAVIASVLVLQTLEDRSDTEAMDALRCDLRWKVACGLPIDHPGFHPTTLTVWRNRLRGSDSPERIFEAVRAVIAETGVLKGKHRRALDSVVLDDAVATQDTVTQLIAAVRRGPPGGAPPRPPAGARGAAAGRGGPGGEPDRPGGEKGAAAPAAPPRPGGVG